MIKKTCFAYKNGKCTALNKLYCEKEECSFYKSTAKALKPVPGDIDELLRMGGALNKPAKVKADCEYYTGTAGHFCKATGNESCKKCTLYSPKMPTKAQMLANMLATEKASVNRLLERLALAEAPQDRIFDDF